MSFDPAFLFYRDNGPVDRDVPLDDDWWKALAGEARDELARRRASYPGRVTKGRMTRAEADRELRVWGSVLRSIEGGDYVTPVASWTEQAHALRREIALRRKFYPQWIAAGRLDADAAARGLFLVEQWHDILWHCGLPEAIATRAGTAARAAERTAA